MEPKEYVKKLKEETGLNSLNEFTRKNISRQIDLFENRNEKTEVVEEEESKKEVVEEEESKKEVVEDLEDRLDEIDATFCGCIERATNLVYEKLGGIEGTRARMILEVAKIYFEEVRREAKRE